MRDLTPDVRHVGDVGEQSEMLTPDTYREIASFFGLHPGSVGRIVRHRM
jgi:hypothetical protein